MVPAWAGFCDYVPAGVSVKTLHGSGAAQTNVSGAEPEQSWHQLEEMASVCSPPASIQPALPSGPAVFKTVPYAFMLPEIVSMPSFAALQHPANGSSESKNQGAAPKTILKTALMGNNVF